MDAAPLSHVPAPTASDDRSFETCILPLRTELYGHAMRYTRDPASAEDLVQDTLLRAYRAWASFEPGSNARAWAFRILTNSFINNYRRSRRHRRFARENPEDAVRALYGSGRPRRAADPQGALVDDALSDEVARALEELPADYRDVVSLTDLGGARYRDAADALGVPIGTVMSRLFRARRLLEERLADFARTSYGIARATC